MKTKHEHTFTEPGCYADGAFGHSHIRESLAAFVQLASQSEYARQLVDELKQDPSDDYSEEDDALAILDDATNPSLYWHLEDGNLMLSPRVE